MPKSPDFTKTKTKLLERKQFNEGKPPAAAGVIKQAAGGDPVKEHLAKKAKSIRTSSTQGPVKQPSSTKASALQSEKRRMEIEKKKAENEKKEKEDAERKKRQTAVSLHFRR